MGGTRKLGSGFWPGRRDAHGLLDNCLIPMFGHFLPVGEWLLPLKLGVCNHDCN